MMRFPWWIVPVVAGLLIWSQMALAHEARNGLSLSFLPHLFFALLAGGMLVVFPVACRRKGERRTGRASRGGPAMIPPRIFASALLAGPAVCLPGMAAAHETGSMSPFTGLGLIWLFSMWGILFVTVKRGREYVLAGILFVMTVGLLFAIALNPDRKDAAPPGWPASAREHAP